MDTSPTIRPIGLPFAASNDVKTSDNMQHRHYAAFHQTLDLRCKDSDDSSVDTSDSDDDHEEEDVKHEPERGFRLPAALSQLHVDRRRVSSASQRSPRRVGMLTNNRSTDDLIASAPDATADHVKSFRLHRPPPMALDTSPRMTPRIEVEQVFDEEEDGDQEALEKEVEDARVRRRLEARTRMMKALNAGAGGNRISSLRRTESMDVVIGQRSTSTTAKNGSASTAIFAHSPSPRTPGTAFHQRSISCPTPATPQLHQFGHFQVIVTPPTPRPQGSPITGVFIRGVHRPQSATHFCAFDDLDLTHAPPCRQCEAEACLQVPEFEMAPGRANIVRAQRQQALALIAWQQQQQQIALDWSARIKQDESDLNDDLGLQVQLDSPILLPGTPGAPSMLHVQEMRTMHHRHRPDTGSQDGESMQRSSTSWWRTPSSADQQTTTWTGSSASMYSQESSVSSTRSTTNSDKPKPSAADSASSWRRARVPSYSADASLSSSFSAPPTKTNGFARCNLSRRAYIPPAKRIAVGTVTVVNATPRNADAPLSRKEGSAASMVNAARSHAAQSMLARLGTPRS